MGYFNLLINLDMVGDSEQLQATAVEALPIFERAMKLNAEDLDARVKYAIVLLFADRREDAKRWAVQLLLEPELDGSSLYNLGCLLCEVGESQSAIASLRRSIERGYKNKELFYNSALLDPLRNIPEFQSALALLDDDMANQHA
jgi:tetratricopeptide (TPR) repeat protein